jgi:hypothetical protein
MLAHGSHSKKGQKLGASKIEENGTKNKLDKQPKIKNSKQHMRKRKRKKKKP